MEHKFDFTPTGVAQMMDQLYAQSPTAIEAEAIAAETDFYSWMQSKFELSPTQLDYMLSLGDAFSEDTGSSLAQAFRNRSPVSMTKGEVAIRSYKFIRKEQQETTQYAPDTESEYTEALHFYIS